MKERNAAAHESAEDFAILFASDSQASLGSTDALSQVPQTSIYPLAGV